MLNVIVGLVLSVFIIFSLFVRHCNLKCCVYTRQFQPDMPRNNVEVFLNHFEDTLKMLLLVGHGRRSRFVRIEEVILSSFFIIVGFIFHLAILVQVIIEFIIKTICIWLMLGIVYRLWKYFRSISVQTLNKWLCMIPSTRTCDTRHCPCPSETGSSFTWSLSFKDTFLKYLFLNLLQLINM